MFVPVILKFKHLDEVMDVRGQNVTQPTMKLLSLTSKSIFLPIFCFAAAVLGLWVLTKGFSRARTNFMYRDLRSDTLGN